MMILSEIFFSLASYSVFLASSLIFIPLSLSRILCMCRHHYLSTPANPFISYFYSPRKGFSLILLPLQSVFRVRRNYQGKVKVTTRRTKIMSSKITFFSCNFGTIRLFILLSGREGSASHSVENKHEVWIKTLFSGLYLFIKI